MANELDETNMEVRKEGRDIHVIQKQLSVTKTSGDKAFEIILWVLFIIPGLIFWFMKKSAKEKLDQQQQKVQAAASSIDNYMEQRVQILKNCAKLLDKAIDLDSSLLSKIAAYRGGVNPENDAKRNQVIENIDKVNRAVSVAFENYPDIKAHNQIAEAMQQNSYLQREITAARDLYNDAVLKWNKMIFDWPTFKIVAAENNYTTRLPFTASEEIKNQARGTFF